MRTKTRNRSPSQSDGVCQDAGGAWFFPPSQVVFALDTKGHHSHAHWWNPQLLITLKRRDQVVWTFVRLPRVWVRPRPVLPKRVRGARAGQILVPTGATLPRVKHRGLLCLRRGNGVRHSSWGDRSREAGGAMAACQRPARPSMRAPSMGTAPADGVAGTAGDRPLLPGCKFSWGRDWSCAGTPHCRQ